MPVEGVSTRDGAASGLVDDPAQYVINGHLAKYTLAALMLQDEPMMSSERELACKWLAEHVRAEWLEHLGHTTPPMVVTEDAAAAWLKARYPLWAGGDYVSSAELMVRWVKVAFGDFCTWQGRKPF